jgi:regulatory protein
MKITAISPQVKNPHRINVFVDGKYRLSLDVAQYSELGIRVGTEVDEEKLATLEEESAFGKLYVRTLEYCLLRPRSMREVRDYLYRKTKPTRAKTGGIKAGVSSALTDRVMNRLIEKEKINDERFSRHWVENRHIKKGTSQRKLAAELAQKGVVKEIVDRVLGETERRDANELAKVIAKKRTRYPDTQKLMAYLARQGFTYDDIKKALETV